jgi:thiosulfate dehydrogenase [quinone] large subunit
MRHSKGHYALALVRIALGLLFLWAFFDKLLGLGFATSSANAWINGGSPTAGFLANAVTGPFSTIYHSLSGLAVIDWLFMLGLLVIGLGLTFGIATRFSCYSGTLLMLLMWSSLLPPKNHPFIDEHIIYALALIAIALSDTGSVLGLQKKWQSLHFVRKMPWLR